VLRAAPFHDFRLERYVPADRICVFYGSTGVGRGIMCAKRKNPPVRAGFSGHLDFGPSSKSQAYRPREGGLFQVRLSPGIPAAYAGRLERAGNRAPDIPVLKRDFAFCSAASCLIVRCLGRENLLI
jgi:hypothetical protein